jgi:hypothetical protein
MLASFVMPCDADTRGCLNESLHIKVLYGDNGILLALEGVAPTNARESPKCKSNVLHKMD